MKSETQQTSHQVDKRIYWQRILKEWKESGESQRIYCEGKNLNFHTFSYWHTKFKKLNVKEAISPFSKARITPPYKNPLLHSIQIHLPNGNKIQFPSSINKVELKTLLDLLGIFAC